MATVDEHPRLTKLRRFGSPLFGLTDAQRFMYLGGGSSTSDGKTWRSLELRCEFHGHDVVVVTSDAGSPTYRRKHAMPRDAALRDAALPCRFADEGAELTVYESAATWHAFGELGGRWIELHGDAPCPFQCDLRHIAADEIDFSG